MSTIANKSIKQALQLVPENEVFNFLPFVPIDNISMTSTSNLSQSQLSASSLAESSSSVIHNTTLLTALIKADFMAFLKNVIDNKNFHLFVDSYIAYRSKPFFQVDEGSQSSVQLFRLDKLMFTVFYRITCPGDEHHKFEQCFRKTAYFGSSKDSTVFPNTDLNVLDHQYKELFDDIKIMKVPYLMEIAAIIGESNQHLSHKLFSGVMRWYGCFSNELSLVLQETHRATLELVQTMWQAWSRLVSSVEKVSSVPKKGIRVIDKAAISSKLSSTDHLREVCFLTSFGADIVYGLCRLIASLDRQYLVEESKIYHSVCLSKDLGMVIFRILQMIYEIAVPTAIKSIRKGRHIKEPSPDTIKLIDKIEDFVEVCLYWCMKTLMELVDVVQQYQNNSHGFIRRGKFSPGIEKNLSSQNWIDVLSNKLDIDQILVGANFEPSELELGSLCSDYLHVVDRSKLISFLKSTMGSYDEGNIDYFLNTMRVDSSSSLKNLRKSRGGNKSDNTSHVSEVLQKLAISSDCKLEADVLKPNDTTMQNNISMIQSIFPDYGEGFIEACLGFYKNNAEEVIDAFVSDNLHPQLSSIDRSLKKMWVGKQSLVRDNSTLLYTNEKSTSKAHEEKISYKAFMNSNQQENKRFQEIQKAVVKNIEKSQEYDAYIVDKEYDDDYDDQFDDSWATRKPVNNGSDLEDDDRRSENKDQQKVDWRKQMTETRRFNSLLREEEKEILFWKGMENKNRVDANICRSDWKEKLEDSVEEDGNDDFENHSSTKMDGSSKNQPSSKSNDEQKKGNKRSQNAKVEKQEDQKTKQTQRKEYERKERQSDAFRKGRRLKKERQGGFIPGTGN